MLLEHIVSCEIYLCCMFLHSGSPAITLVLTCKLAFWFFWLWFFIFLGYGTLENSCGFQISSFVFCSHLVLITLFTSRDASCPFRKWESFCIEYLFCQFATKHFWASFYNCNIYNIYILQGKMFHGWWICNYRYCWIS